MYSSNQKRSYESPMDWEWQTTGPSDPKTPFPQFKPQPGQKRGNFESPRPASSFVTASSTPAAQFRNPSFTTPRKPFDQDLFSEVSGAESSPADNADAEDTPELPRATNAMTLNNGNEKPPIFGRYGMSFSTSPGRGEIRKVKHSNVLVKKIRKRKRMEKDYALMAGTRTGSETESEDESGSRSGRKTRAVSQKPGFWTGIANFIEERPQLPSTLSFWVQLALNTFLVGALIAILWSMWGAVRQDINNASNEAVAAVVAKMAACEHNYLQNRCGRDLRLPAMELQCNEWDHCMNQDPESVRKGRLSAHEFAHIINNFIEPISYKTMICLALLLCGGLMANNMAFGSFRQKHQVMAHQPYFPPPAQNFQWGNGVMPQTPRHNDGGVDMYGTPYHQIMPSHTPMQRSPSKESRSPSKRDRSPSKGNRY